jgi:hypothetical protein
MFLAEDPILLDLQKASKLQDRDKQQQQKRKLKDDGNEHHSPIMSKKSKHLPLNESNKETTTTDEKEAKDHHGSEHHHLEEEKHYKTTTHQNQSTESLTLKIPKLESHQPPQNRMHTPKLTPTTIEEKFNGGRSSSSAERHQNQNDINENPR